MRRTTALARRAPTEDTRTEIELVGGGSGRGLQGLLGPISEWNGRSDRTTIKLRAVDPVPGRAFAVASEASARGITARLAEVRVQDLLAQEGDAERSPAYLALDDPGSDASALEVLATQRRPVLGGLLIRTPWEELIGLRWTLAANDTENKRLGARFFTKLAEVTARRGSAYVVGERGRSEHAAAEKQYRAWFGEGATMNAGRIAVGIEPEVVAPFTVTTNGRNTLPLLLRDSGPVWADPIEIAADLVTSPTTPIILVKNEEFAIGEIGPDGIRIHRVRLRHDGRISLRGGAAVDRETLQAVEDHRRAEAVRLAWEAREREEAARQAEARAREAARQAEVWEKLRPLAEAAIARAMRQSLSRQSAAFVTD